MSDVSRETPKPDILDEIMGRDPAYGGAPPQRQGETAPEAPPGPEDPAPAQEQEPEQEPEQEQGPKREAPKKDKRSSVFIYLMILFGAAFMMLLLAYFVQARNSQTTINDLRDSMTLSREELMEQIAQLEESNEQFQALLQSALKEVSQKDGKIELLVQNADSLNESSLRNYWRAKLAGQLGWLERFCAEGDWLMAAVIVEHSDFQFNPSSKDYEKSPAQVVDANRTSVQAARWLELRERVFEKTDLFAIEGAYTAGDKSDRTESILTVITEDTDADALIAARQLWVIIDEYSSLEYQSASSRILNFYLNGGSLDQLGKTFRPSTVELFGQIIDDLNDLGLLERNGDGTVSFPVGNDQSVTFAMDSGEVVQSDLPISVIAANEEAKHIELGATSIDVSRETPEE